MQQTNTQLNAAVNVSACLVYDTAWKRPYQVFNLTRNSQCWKICSNSKPTKQMQSEWKTLRSNRTIRFLSLHTLLGYIIVDTQVNTGKERTKENKGFYCTLTNLKSELCTQVGKLKKINGLATALARNPPRITVINVSDKNILFNCHTTVSDKDTRHNCHICVQPFPTVTTGPL